MVVFTLHFLCIIKNTLRDMKKIFFSLLMALPVMMVAMSSCDDDNDVPKVSIQATISGGTFEGDEIFVTQGDDLVIDGLTLVNGTGKEGALGAVSYYWDHFMIGTNIVEPYVLTINTAKQPIGRHLLQAWMPIYVVDYPICWGYVWYVVNIVASDEDQPEGDGSTSKIVTGVVTAKNKMES